MREGKFGRTRKGEGDVGGGRWRKMGPDFGAAGFCDSERLNVIIDVSHSSLANPLLTLQDLGTRCFV